MSSYVIVDVDITDASLYGQFVEQVTATVEANGGRFVVRGGAFETILVDWTPSASPYLNSAASSRSAPD